MSLPKRIISLVPSQTELLADLGLEDEVVGITKFCVHPDRWYRSKVRVGGTKNINLEVIRKLQPDLIIANKEENVREQVEDLMELAPVYVTDISDLSGALDMIEQAGKLTGRQVQAEALIATINERFKKLKTDVAPIACAYFIWKNPWMVAGGDTFINDMLERAGFINVFRLRSRYPAIDLVELATSGCRQVFLSSEPYPFKDKHIKEISTVLPQARITLVDGEMFSWYGSRLQYAPAYFGELRQE